MENVAQVHRDARSVQDVIVELIDEEPVDQVGECEDFDLQIGSFRLFEESSKAENEWVEQNEIHQKATKGGFQKFKRGYDQIE